MVTKLDIQEKDGFLIMNDFPDNCIFTYSGAYPFIFRQLIKHKNSL